jgi:hypothetical protein
MRFDPSTLSSQPSTAADISPSSSRLAKSFGVVIPTFFAQRIASGDETWDQMVPPQVAEIIRRRGFFGYKQR